MQKRFSHDVWAFGKDINAIRTRARKLRGVAKWQGGWNCYPETPSLIPALNPSWICSLSSQGQLPWSVGFLNLWATKETTCLPVILLPL